MVRGNRLPAFVVLGTVALTGCGRGLKAGPAESPTGGVTIEVLRSDEQSSHALYRLDSNGTLSVGGGFDALQRRTTWSAALSDDQIASLRALLFEHGWFELRDAAMREADRADGAQAGASDDLEYRISFASPEFSWSDRVKAGDPHFDSVVEFLRELSLARHADFLDSLPQPGQSQSNGQ